MRLKRKSFPTTGTIYKEYAQAEIPKTINESND